MCQVSLTAWPQLTGLGLNLTWNFGVGVWGC